MVYKILDVTVHVLGLVHDPDPDTAVVDRYHGLLGCYTRLQTCFLLVVDTSRSWLVLHVAIADHLQTCLTILPNCF